MPRHATLGPPIPQKGNDYDPNWNAVQSAFYNEFPVCVTAQGDPGTIVSGTPGPASFITWIPPTNQLYDVSNIVGPTQTTNLRIPTDGFYDFWFMFRVGISATGRFALEFALDTANTSDSGFTTPTWTRRITGPTFYVASDLGGATGAVATGVLFRGVEMHSNDLVRFPVAMYADASGPPVSNIIGSTVTFSEFRMTYPIPNQQVLQP